LRDVVHDPMFAGRAMTVSLLTLVFGPPEDDIFRQGDRDRRTIRAAVDGAHEEPSVADDDAELALVERLRASDGVALDTIIDRYYRRLVGYAESIVRDVGHAEDVVQDVLFLMWERRAGLVIHTSLAAYLFTLVRNAALNARRGTVTRTRWMQQYAAESPPPATSADFAIERDERVRVLQAALEALAPRYREVLVLRAHGLTYDAISSVLGIPLKTAKTRGLRGIAMLRAALMGKL